MKVAIIHPSLKVKGGAENVVVWLAEELSRRGHKVTIFVSEYDDEFYGHRNNKSYEIVDIGGRGYQSGIIDHLKIGFNLRNKLKEYDVVNPHNFPAHIWVYFAQFFSCSKFRYKVWSCNEPKRDLYFETCSPHYRDMLPVFLASSLKLEVSRMVDKLAARSMDTIFSISSTIAEQVSRIYKARDVQVCLMGIPLERFSLKDAQAVDENYILTVSKLEKRKNIDSIIYAVNILVKEKRFNGFKYYIAGTGSEYGHIKGLIKNLGLNDYVVLKGFVSDQVLHSLYAGCALLIYLPIDEPLGLPFLEAAVYKRAVIAPNHGGPLDIVVDEKTGLFVDPFNPFDIAEGIFTLVSNRVKADEMGIAAYRLLRENFTMEKYAGLFESKIFKNSF